MSATALPSPLRCADAAQARGDALAATAPPATRLLLLEHPGPWARDAVRDSFPVDVGRSLAARASAVDARMLLVRRVGRERLPATNRWALVDTTPGSERTWWGSYSDVRDLRELPLDGSAGEASDELTYLICTHGRHDTCCAVRGRPVAAALAAQRPDQTWECSHVGGDRFAANVVVAPYGLYYGYLAAVGVPDFVEDCEAGLVQVGRLRGRTSYSAPVQAAQHYARLRLGDRRIDAFLPLAQTEREHEGWHVRLGHADGVVDVVVRATLAPAEGRLTCAAVRPGHIRTFVLQSFEVGTAE